MKPALLSHLAVLILGVGGGYLMFNPAEKPDRQHNSLVTDSKGSDNLSSRLFPETDVGIKKNKASQTQKASTAQPLSIDELYNYSPTTEQLEAHLEKCNRHPYVLLACALEKSNSAWLREALEKSPTDPLLLFHAASNSDFELSEEERTQHLNTFLQTSPNNTYGYTLKASHYLLQGDPQNALKFLRNIPEEAQFNDYSKETLAESLDLMLATSDLPSEVSKTSCIHGHSSGHKFDLLKLTRGLADFSGKLSPDESEEIRILAASLGDQLSSSSDQPTILDKLIGAAISKTSMRHLKDHDNSPYDNLNKKEALSMLHEQTSDITATYRELEEKIDLETLFTNPANRPLLRRYNERMSLLGEGAANKWMLRHLNSAEQAP